MIPQLQSMLSGKDILSSQSRSQELPDRDGSKKTARSGSPREQASVSAARQEWRVSISQPLVACEEKLCVADWLPHIARARLRSVGRFFQTFGYSMKEENFLFPEEALFLSELGQVQLHSQDIPLTLQESFQLLFQSVAELSFDKYLVFAHLSRAGYVVRRHHSGGPLLSEYERSIRLDAYIRRPAVHQHAAAAAAAAAAEAPTNSEEVSLRKSAENELELQLDLSERAHFQLEAEPADLRSLRPGRSGRARAQTSIPKVITAIAPCHPNARRYGGS